MSARDQVGQFTLLADKRDVVNAFGRATDPRMAAKVSGSFWDSPGAQANELAAIDRDMRAFDAEALHAAQAHGLSATSLVTPQDVIAASTPAGKAALDAKLKAAPATSDPIVHFYLAVWSPFWNAWQKFFHENKDGSWWNNPEDNAEEYQRKLIEHRNTIRALGAKLLSSDPEAYAASFFDPNRGAVNKIGDAIGSMGTLLKYGLYAALGLGAAYAGVTIVNMARGRKR